MRPTPAVKSAGAMRNTFADWKQATGFDASSTFASSPGANVVVVQPNTYEPGRANVIIYNWAHQSSVSVDLSQVLKPNDKFEVRNAQSFYAAPVLTGTYAGGSIALPITSITPPPSISPC